jgi:ABC-2 type transport system permease protein
VLLVVLFTSLGLGFLISLVAKTDMQAVQYAMFLLLGSIFFSGFFLDLRYLWEPVRVVSWALPATYGIKMLQDTALRGAPINALLFYALLGIGVGLYIISWLLLRRRLALSV